MTETETLNEDFLNLILQYEDALYNRAMKLHGSRMGVEDLVQDTILRALANEAKFKRGTNLRAWLFTLQFRLFVNQFRRRQTYRDILSYHSETVRDYTTAKMPRSQGSLLDDSNGSLEESALLVLLKTHLDDIFYEVLEAIVVREMTYKEAARLFDVPVGTVMSRLHRARRKSRQILVTYYDPTILSDMFSAETLAEIEPLK